MLSNWAEMRLDVTMMVLGIFENGGGPRYLLDLLMIEPRISPYLSLRMIFSPAKEWLLEKSEILARA